MSGIHLDAIDVCVNAGRTPILQKVSFSIRPGEFIGILGPSGCGKSTLLKTLSGIISPSSGRVLMNGLPVAEAGFQSRIGYVPQDDIVHGSLRVDRALSYSARLRLPMRTAADSLRARVDEVIALMDLDERRKTRIDRLSGGQRKRVSIGVELLTQPALLFLDEPTSGLDPALEEKMMDLFARLASEGRTVILTTHIMQSIDRLHLVAVMAKGRLVYFGPPSDLTRYFSVPHVQDLYRVLAAETNSIADGLAASPTHVASLESRRYRM